MSVRGLARGRRTFRRGQSIVLFALAMLTVTACAMGPFYERAVEQATLRNTLLQADRISRSLVIDVPDGASTASVAPTGPAAHLFAPAVGGTDVQAVLTTPAHRTYTTTVTSRDGICRQLVLAAGRCADTSGDVVASATTAHALGLRLGQILKVTLPGPSSSGRFVEKLHIVGLYRPFGATSDYWLGRHYSSPNGFTISSGDNGGTVLLADAFFGSSDYVSTLASRVVASQGDPLPTSHVDVALRPDGITLQDLQPLRATLNRLQGVAENSGGFTAVQTALPDLLAQIDAGRRDARTIILAIAAQLALLALIALGVVVSAAADQRRPELAIARLRGQSLRRTSGVFVRELGSLAVAAAVPGLLAAWGMTYAACRIWLVPGVDPEWRWPAVAAVAAALVVTLALVAIIGYRTSTQPISDMLRQVPARVSRAGLGVAEVGVAVAAVAGLIVSQGGDKHSVLVTLTPTFLAVLVGLVLSRLIVAAGRYVGRRALWHGAIPYAMAAMGIARRPGGRFTVTVLCVATAVVVFAGQQWGVGSRNRTERAAAETGAAVVLDLATSDGPGLVRAVDSADPGGHYAAPVVVVRPPGIGAVPVVATDPARFGAVASWGRADLHPTSATLDRMHPARLAPRIDVTGTTISLTLGSVTWDPITTHPDTPRPGVAVQLELAHRDGRTDSVTFAGLPRSAPRGLTLTSPASCSDGCRVTGLAFTRAVLDTTSIDVRIVVTSIAGRTSSTIRAAADWASVTPTGDLQDTSGQESMTVTPTAGGVQFHALDDGRGATAQYLEVPVGAPALLAGAQPPDRDALGFLTGAGVGGTSQRLVVRDRVPFVPQIGGAALMVDLGLAVVTSPTLDSTAQPSVWLSSNDPVRERALIATLQRNGIHVVDRHTTEAAAAAYSDSASGWSARLTLVVAAIAVLLAVTLLGLVVQTSRRTRQQDLAAMRMSGLSRRRLRRATVLEFLVIVVVGVAGGAIAGLVAVHLSLSAIPVFTTPALVPLPVTYGLDPSWLVGGLAVTAVLLVGAGVLLGRRLVSAARPQDLRGTGA